MNCFQNTPEFYDGRNTMTANGLWRIVVIVSGVPFKRAGQGINGLYTASHLVVRLGESYFWVARKQR